MDNIKSAFTDFCRSTSLHGWHHLTDTQGNTRGVTKNGGRFMWILIVSASIGVASFFLFTSVDDFTGKYVATSIDTTTAPLHVSTHTFYFYYCIHFSIRNIKSQTFGLIMTLNILLIYRTCSFRQ